MSTSLIILSVILSFMVMILTGFLYRLKKVPMYFISYHLYLALLPTITSLIALLLMAHPIAFGPLHFDRFGLTLGAFINLIGFVVQRFSMRYLQGDLHYRAYFGFFSLATSAMSLTWLSDDLRVLLLLLGIALWSMLQLFRCSSAIKPAMFVMKRARTIFLIAWLSLLAATIMLYRSTHTWSLHQIAGKTVALTPLSITIGLLLLLPALLLAAQWPFQRWLLESAIFPTPVSALMHAGFVNLGGVLLTRFANYTHFPTVSLPLLLISLTSILIGQGIVRVAVDYKRQLLGSTIAQMGFMLVQCALGAYLAAIIHLILHGLFKAMLFLQAGSAAQHQNETIVLPSHRLERFWQVTLTIVITLLYGFADRSNAYAWLSGLILGMALGTAFTQLVLFSSKISYRFLGAGVLLVIGVLYLYVQQVMTSLLSLTLSPSLLHNNIFAIPLLALFVLVVFSLERIGKKPDSKLYLRLYLYFVATSEPSPKATQTHPHHLSQWMA
nr:NADH dehydrogenase subunit 5 [Bacilli bacterium]